MVTFVLGCFVCNVEISPTHWSFSLYHWSCLRFCSWDECIVERLFIAMLNFGTWSCSRFCSWGKCIVKVHTFWHIIKGLQKKAPNPSWRIWVEGEWRLKTTIAISMFFGEFCQWFGAFVLLILANAKSFCTGLLNFQLLKIGKSCIQSYINPATFDDLEEQAQTQRQPHP